MTAGMDRAAVLAVLDREIASAESLAVSDAYHADRLPKLREARAAVAELIEAHGRLLDYVLSEAEARDYDPPVDTQIVADSMAALARCGAAS